MLHRTRRSSFRPANRYAHLAGLEPLDRYRPGCQILPLPARVPDAHEADRLPHGHLPSTRTRPHACSWYEASKTSAAAAGHRPAVDALHAARTAATSPLFAEMARLSGVDPDDLRTCSDRSGSAAGRSILLSTGTLEPCLTAR